MAGLSTDLPDAAYLRQRFDDRDGVLVWKARPGSSKEIKALNRRIAGTEAGKWNAKTLQVMLDGRLYRVVDVLAKMRGPEISAAPVEKHEPHPYQAEGIEWLAGRRRALLADEPGLGKTLQVIRAADRAGFLRLLVVCPASLVENWRREISAQRNGDWTAFVTSYDMMAGRHFDQIMAQKWCGVVFDEAHYLKNPATKRAKLAYGALTDGADGVISAADYVWALTGTPMPNHAAELWPHLRALDPGRILLAKTGRPWSYFQFAHHFCQQKPGFGGHLQIVGSKNEERLNALIDGFMLRRLKKDVLADLPPLSFGELFVQPEMTDEDLGLDAEEIRRIRETLAVGGIEDLRGQYTHFASLRRATGLAKVKPVVAYLREWLESTNRKIVVFGQHLDVLRAIFRAGGICDAAVRIEGNAKARERQSAVDRFQNDPQYRVFIGQINAAGTGLTLTAASDVLFIESSWTPADNAQAAMRVHRIGQRDGCHARFVMISGSIDETVQRAVMRKTASIAKVLGDQPMPDVEN